MSDEPVRKRLERLEERIDHLEAENRELRDAVGDDGTANLNRRQALGLAGGLGFGVGGLLAAAGQPAAAASTQPSQSAGTPWEDVDGVNDVHIVPSGGSIQDAIDRAATGSLKDAIVRLLPGEVYDENAEIHLRPRVTLDFNGGRLVVSDDHNGIFVDSGAAVLNANVHVSTSNYTSAAIVLDTARAADERYGIGTRRSNVRVQGTLIGSHGRGNGLELSDTAGVGIALGNRFDLDITRFGTGVYANTGSGFINGIEARFAIVGSRIGLDIQGNGPFNSEINGAMQPTKVSEIGIRNETGSIGPAWHGQLFDSNRYTNNALVGERITVIGSSSYSLRGNTDGSSRQMGVSYKDGRVNLIDYPTDRTWTMNIARDSWNLGSIDANGERHEYLRILSDGKIRPGVDGWLNLDPEDLRYRKPRGPGEIALAGQRATTSNGVELAISGVGGNWNTWSGDKIRPE